MVEGARKYARCGGVSLVECLVASALALSLLAGITMIAAELIAETQATERRSDQVTRAEQLFAFLEQMVKTAGLPSRWPQPAGASLQVGVSAVDPCIPPSAKGVSKTWGGIWIVELAALDCIDSSDSGQGLYIERIEACDDVCAPQALLPVACTNHHEALPSRVGWMFREWHGGVVDRDCFDHFGWGSLSRTLIYHRPRVPTHDRSSDLVLRQALPEKGDQWSTAEALIEGVTMWELGSAQLVDVPALPEGARAPIVTVALDSARGTTAEPEDLIQLRRTLITPSLLRTLLARNKAES